MIEIREMADNLLSVLCCHWDAPPEDIIHVITDLLAELMVVEGGDA